MRIMFIGAVDFSQHCLQEVLDNGGQVVAVLNPEPSYARSNSDYKDLSPLAVKYGIPLYRFRKIGDPETVAQIRSLCPDVIFVFGFSQLIPKEVLNIPLRGCIGTHPALLPRNRGRHPLIWALAEGLTESGLTFFYLDHGADSGDILWQKPFSITLNDTAATLYVKIKNLAADAIREFLPLLETGAAPRQPQDHSLATYWRKRTEADGEINWSIPSMKVYNLIRALTRPYPGAHSFLREHRLVIWKGRLHQIAESDRHGAPGEVFQKTPEGFMVMCKEGAIEILEWESADKVNLSDGTKLGR